MSTLTDDVHEIRQMYDKACEKEKTATRQREALERALTALEGRTDPEARQTSLLGEFPARGEREPTQ